MTEHNQSTSNSGGNRTLAFARALGQSGYLVFPCKPFSKAPATANGFKDASCDRRDIDAWFDNDHGYNLAIACGPQPNGVNLFALDVDPKNGGHLTWAALCNGRQVDAPRHTTPSGGFHLFFDAPAGVGSSRNRLGPGIDHRCAGGYVVVPPSRLVNEAGEPIDYITNPATALVRHMPPGLPLWIIEGLEPVTEHEHISLPLGPSGDGMFAWLRGNFDYVAELEADGWEVGGHRGAQVYVVRPGKPLRDGHSGVVHRDSNHLVVWSTTVDWEVFRPNQVNVDGSTSWSPFDYLQRVRFDGDFRRTEAYVLALMGRTPVRANAEAPPTDATSLNLDSTFWTERPCLTHIRDAAWSAGCSPDALLIHALARVATYVHPCFKLPGTEQGLIGKHQTLDFLGCVVAETSGGKTLAAGVGEMLIPAPEPPMDGSDPLIDFEQKVGSGEGIAEFFLVPEMRPDDDGKLKATGRRIVGKQALFMSVDEGTGFTNQAGRKGTTIVATLASAWSGESLGQLNAAAETRRLVQGGRVRICAVINMQDSNGWKLYTDELESVGFTGRLLFASAHDPSAPAFGTQPSWPEMLDWPIRSGSAIGNQYFSYDDSIVAEIWQTRHGILTNRLHIERRQSQYLLLRCKVAALFAVLDGRLNVTADDWRLATSVIDMSSRVLSHLDTVHGSQVEATAVTAAEFKIKVSSTAEERHVRRLSAGWQTKILGRLAKGPRSWKGLRDIVESKYRDALRVVLDEMVAEGAIRKDGHNYVIDR